MAYTSEASFPNQVCSGKSNYFSFFLSRHGFMVSKIIIFMHKKSRPNINMSIPKILFMMPSGQLFIKAIDWLLMNIPSLIIRFTIWKNVKTCHYAKNTHNTSFTKLFLRFYTRLEMSRKKNIIHLILLRFYVTFIFHTKGA